MEPWRSQLEEGNPQTAWDLFDAQYRRLILAVIRRLVPDHDDVMDVFSTVCQALCASDFSRLRSYSQRSTTASGAATWVVAVVRNLTIDWLRQRDGRRRISVPQTLTPLQQEIFTAVCIDGHSHVEAYELIRSRSRSAMAFHQFLREVRATFRVASCPDNPVSRRTAPDTPAPEAATTATDPAESAESVRRLAEALASQPADVRLAVELFVVERMSAADVARVVGWPNGKAVYNRVYRALASLRARLEAEGIGPGDL